MVRIFGTLPNRRQTPILDRCEVELVALAGAIQWKTSKRFLQILARLLLTLRQGAGTIEVSRPLRCPLALREVSEALLERLRAKAALLDVEVVQSDLRSAGPPALRRLVSGRRAAGLAGQVLIAREI